jgi:1,4-dihydroxy-2-naphthoyl-CoA synthase
MSSIAWKTVKDYQDITYKKCSGVARIAFNRPEVRNAFRPKTVAELFEALLMRARTPALVSFYFQPKGHRQKMVCILFAAVVTSDRAVIRAMSMMTACLD